MTPHEYRSRLDTLYVELCAISRELNEWYSVDKVKTFGVYVWTKLENEDDDYNVFDIYVDDVEMYDDEHRILEEAEPIIKRIQDKLEEMYEVRLKMMRGDE